MLTFLIILSLIYLIIHLLLFYGLIRESSHPKIKQQKAYSVSVIVAARNEERVISECISSLKKLKYNKELLEIILVNDNSDDRTKEIMIKETEGIEYFKIINSQKQESNNLKGKANAIDSGIKIASGDIILTTDADCVVPDGWIEESIQYYDENTAMVCGITLMKPNKNIFSVLQNLDWLYLLTLASGSCGIKLILSCIGNNLSYRKNIYIETGGYEKIKFSVTEDFAFMRTIYKQKIGKIKFPINSSNIVISDECKTLTQLVQQKRRWFRGGLKINLLGYILAFEFYVLNFVTLFGLFFLNPLEYIIILSIRIISELMLIIPSSTLLKLKSIVIYYPLFLLYFSIYGLILPLTFINGISIKWKDRKF